MEYIINYKNKALLNKATYISMDWAVRDDILTVAHDYQAHIILDTNMDFTSLEAQRLCREGKHKVIFKVHSIDNARICRDNDFPFFFDNYLKNFQELYWAVNEFQPNFIMIDAPLFHEIDKVRAFDVPIILTPTEAIHDVYDKGSGINGTYILPQDAILYQDCIFTFGDCDTLKEKTLYEIYERGEWPGNVNFLINDLDSEAQNRLIVRDFGERRANCGMRCMESRNACHLCETVLHLAEMKDELKEAL